MSSLRLALVQKASSLDAADNRAALGPVADLLEPGTDLVLLPEAFMRDFGAPDTDLAATAEPLDGPFVQRLTAFAADAGTTVVAGMFETSDDPGRPFNTLVVVDRRRAAGVVPEDPSLRLLRLPRVRPAARRARWSRSWSTSAGSGSA